MREVWLIILGSAITLLGSVVATMLQASREDRRWRLQRDEERRREAAIAVSDAWAFFDETQPEWIVHSPPDIAHEEFDRLDAAYSRLGPPLRRIMVVDRSRSEAVERVTSEMGGMIGQIALCIRDDQDHPDELASAMAHRQQGQEACDLLAAQIHS